MCGHAKKNIVFYCCWSQTRETLLLMYQAEDQADCCWIGFHICNINVLDDNERECVRLKETTRKKEDLCLFHRLISDERWKRLRLIVSTYKEVHLWCYFNRQTCNPSTLSAFIRQGADGVPIYSNLSLSHTRLCCLELTQFPKQNKCGGRNNHIWEWGTQHRSETASLRIMTQTHRGTGNRAAAKCHSGGD